jgi:hypothetical protein
MVQMENPKFLDWISYQLIKEVRRKHWLNEKFKHRRWSDVNFSSLYTNPPIHHKDVWGFIYKLNKGL